LNFSNFLRTPNINTLNSLKTSENVLNHNIATQHRQVIQRIIEGRAPSGSILIEYLMVAQNMREKINSLRKVIGDLELEV
jgi:hypothetical protein